jgi:hypothetical protein
MESTLELADDQRGIWTHSTQCGGGVGALEGESYIEESRHREATSRLVEHVSLSIPGTQARKIVRLKTVAGSQNDAIHRFFTAICPHDAI